MVVPSLVLPASAAGETITVTYEPENYVIHYSNQWSPTGRALISVNQMGTNANGATVGTNTANDRYYLEYTIKNPGLADKVTLKMPGVKLKNSASSTEFDFTVKANLWFSTEERQSPVTGIYEDGTAAYTTWSAYCQSGYVDRGDGNGNVQVISKILGSGLVPSSFTNPVVTSNEVNYDVEMDITNVENSKTSRALLADLVERQENGESHLDFLFTANGASGTNQQDNPAWATGTTVEVEYDRDAIIAYINEEDVKARLTECADLLEIDMSAYETVGADDFEAYIGMISTYEALEQMLADLLPQSEKDKAPVYKPVTLNYNVSNLFQEGEIPSTGGNVHGSNGYICADMFRAQDIWDEEWTDGMTENILTANGVKFKMKVESGSSAKTATTAMIGTLDNDSNWMTIDIDDMKYTSVDILAYYAMSRANLGTATFRLNYTDGPSEYADLDLVDTLTNDPTTTHALSGETYTPNADYLYGKLATTVRIGNNATALASTKNGYFSHFRIPADSEKVLDNIQMLRWEYDLTDNGDGTYTESEIYNPTTVTKAVNIHAITGVTTVGVVRETLADSLAAKITALMEEGYDKEKIDALQAEIEAAEEMGVYTSDISNYDEFCTFIVNKAPAYRPVDLSGKYNVNHLFSNELYGSGKAHGSNGYICTDEFKALSGWKAQWTDGMIENTLTANGVDFSLKVADVADETHKNDNVAVAALPDYMDEGSKWMTIDMDNMKYTSVDFLGYFALSTAKWGTTTVKLNYATGEPEYWNSGDVATLGQNPADYSAYGSVAVQYGAGSVVDNPENKNYVKEESGYMSHYRIPTDSTRVLTDIQILSAVYDLDTEGNEVYVDGATDTTLTGTSGTKATNIHAITGVTTVEEENNYVPENILSFTPTVRVDSANNKVYADLAMVNTTASDAGYVLILAAYGEGNKLLGITASAQKTILKNKGKDTDSINMAIPENTISYKAMVWDSITGMRPYAAAGTNP